MASVRSSFSLYPRGTLHLEWQSVTEHRLHPYGVSNWGDSLENRTILSLSNSTSKQVGCGNTGWERESRSPTESILVHTSQVTDPLMLTLNILQLGTAFFRFWSVTTSEKTYKSGTNCRANYNSQCYSRSGDTNWYSSSLSPKIHSRLPSPLASTSVCLSGFHDKWSIPCPRRLNPCLGCPCQGLVALLVHLWFQLSLGISRDARRSPVFYTFLFTPIMRW